MQLDFRSILETEKEHLTLLVFPPEKERNTCVTIEMGNLTGTCPKHTRTNELKN